MNLHGLGMTWLVSHRIGGIRSVGRLFGSGWKLREQNVPVVVQYHRRIARLVLPNLEMLDLAAPNARDDFNDLRAGRLGQQRVVKAQAALFDRREVKTSSVRDQSG